MRGRGSTPGRIFGIILILTIIYLLFQVARAGAQAGSGAAPCPRPPVLPPQASMEQWANWQGQLGSWMDCVEGGTAAGLNQVISYGAAISQLARENAELRSRLAAEQGAREALSARVDAVDSKAGTLPPITSPLIQDAVWDLFFAQGGKDWQHNVIATAEADWQSRRRLWAADFTRERQCQFVRAGYVAPGPVACP